MNIRPLAIYQYCSQIVPFPYFFYPGNHLYAFTILENLLYISINSKGERDF